MEKQPVSFYSEGHKLDGDLYLPEGLATSDIRAGVVLCHGYTGVKDLYLPDNARVLCDAGYIVLTFDYKGWGKSEGTRDRLAPHSRVADVQAAITFLGAQPQVDEDAIGIYGTSYGGATVVWTAAIDQRVQCVVSVVGVGHGQRWMRSVRRPDEWVDLQERSKNDRVQRTMSGESERADRSEILLPDRQSAALAAAARKNNPNAINTLPLDYIDETLQFHAEWVVDKIAPRPVLFITTDDDRLVPPEESESLYEKAGEPKKLITLRGYGHYEVYVEPAFSEVMTPTVEWFQTYMPATPR
ncbi:MAG: alpha/beta fold hydrolase [Rhodospirillaceae bacterium]|nr:alpha/beta fold hydrolase [Rhodospirillaceae bacterium]MDD9929204.1 alpha/beta fold hydrolase [Rhodospirillaceae bacterium]